MMTQIGRRVFTTTLTLVAAFTLTVSISEQSDIAQAAPAAQTIAVSARSLAVKRAAAYSFATSQNQKPYCWGGGGSVRTASCYDCSGLVLTSFRKQGLLKGSMRTDSDIRYSSKTVHISRYAATKGDLYFTSGHVGFLAGKPYKKGGRWYTPTYGASSSRTGIRWSTRSGVPHIERVMG